MDFLGLDAPARHPAPRSTSFCHPVHAAARHTSSLRPLHTRTPRLRLAALEQREPWPRSRAAARLQPRAWTPRTCRCRPRGSSLDARRRQVFSGAWGFCFRATSAASGGPQSGAPGPRRAPRRIPKSQEPPRSALIGPWQQNNDAGGPHAAAPALHPAPSLGSTKPLTPLGAGDLPGIPLVPSRSDKWAPSTDARGGTSALAGGAAPAGAGAGGAAPAGAAAKWREDERDVVKAAGSRCAHGRCKRSPRVLPAAKPACSVIQAPWAAACHAAQRVLCTESADARPARPQVGRWRRHASPWPGRSCGRRCCSHARTRRAAAAACRCTRSCALKRLVWASCRPRGPCADRGWGDATGGAGRGRGRGEDRWTATSKAEPWGTSPLPGMGVELPGADKPPRASIDRWGDNGAHTHAPAAAAHGLGRQAAMARAS